MITKGGYIGTVWGSGDYPVSIPAHFFIGKYLDDLQDVVEGIPIIKEAISNTIRTGNSMTVHGAVNGQRRVGMTIFINNIHAILRFFAQRY